MARDILVHELNRVRNMTDDQLDVRYGKMNKESKIQKFHEALKKEDRNPSLRNKIAKDLGWDQAPTYTPSVEEGSSWVLKSTSGEDHEYVFVTTEQDTVMEIIEWKNGDKIMADERNIKVARKYWDNLIGEGYKLI